MDNVNATPGKSTLGGYFYTMGGKLLDTDGWNKLFENVTQPVIQQLKDQEEKYILDFFGGDIELVEKYGKDYYIEYSPLNFEAGDDNQYHVSQTMRLKRKEIHP